MDSFSTTKEFEKQFKKLDIRLKQLVLKKMQKIVIMPKLGKPLHKPMQHFMSERIEKLRIIYMIKENNVLFAYLSHRKKVYR